MEKEGEIDRQKYHRIMDVKKGHNNMSYENSVVQLY
jgi:hypothetical protein